MKVNMKLFILENVVEYMKFYYYDYARRYFHYLVDG